MDVISKETEDLISIKENIEKELERRNEEFNKEKLVESLVTIKDLWIPHRHQKYLWCDILDITPSIDLCFLKIPKGTVFNKVVRCDEWYYWKTDIRNDLTFEDDQILKYLEKGSE